MDVTRTLVLGNSGSGKSWLAERLALAAGSGSVDLDAIHWMPGGYGETRERSVAAAMVRRAAAEPRWVIEGVYGWLATEAVPRATAMIWLDIPVVDCLANIERRGPRGAGGEASFPALRAWTADYSVRQTSSSLAGHGALFAAFAGGKARLSSRHDIAAFLASALHRPTGPGPT